MEPDVLLVEDDADLRRVLLRGLAQHGFDVRGAATGAEGLAEVDRGQPDAMVIDIGLPDSDGRDLCQAVRARGVLAPVLFLTAHGALTDRLSGFHAGGDDYLVKPFALSELVVRLRALLRRSGTGAPEAIAGLELDPAAHSVRADGVEVALTPTEYRLLATLAARPGEVVRRRELVASGWPDGAIVHDNTLDTYVARLRRKLRALGRPGAIATAHGVGYRLD
jgi:two-component system OmpR family response regulator